jgi:hypothetical protein
MSHKTQTLAYQPKEFFDLGVAIAKWCADPEIFASFPAIEGHNGRTYYLTAFGYCPQDSGCLGIFAYDNLNGEYLYWSTEDPQYNFDLTPLEACELYNGMAFSTIEALSKYIATGDL